MKADASQTELINLFVDTLKAANPGRELAVILVGSFARNAATANSDVDLLVVATDKVKVERTASRLHVQSISETEFLERLRDGDDFAAWCARFGIPIVRANVWDRIVSSTAARTWPDWRLKIEHAGRRLLLANELLLVGDEDAAAEELAYAVSHVGRALLLRKNVFPMSRPEMIAQLLNAGHPRLSAILQELSFGRMNQSAMHQTIRYLKKLLVFLDRHRFEQYLRKRKEYRALKRKPESTPVAGQEL
jgi:predicted nucleotidyltransferase